MGTEGSSSAGEAGWGSRQAASHAVPRRQAPGWGGGEGWWLIPQAAQMSFVLAGVGCPSPLPAGLFPAASSSFNTQRPCEGSV